MQKKPELRIVTVLKSIFTVRQWADYDRMKSYTTYLVNGLKHLFIPRRDKIDKTFADVIKQQNISEDSLLAQQKALWRLSILMTVIALLLFCYMIYQFVYGSYVGAMVSVVVMLLAWALAFRYSFWCYQIKTRNLGCTVAEWFKHGLLGEKR